MCTLTATKPIKMLNLFGASLLVSALGNQHHTITQKKMLSRVYNKNEIPFLFKYPKPLFKTEENNMQKI